MIHWFKNRASEFCNSHSNFKTDQIQVQKSSIPFTVVSGAIVGAFELILLGHVCDRIKTYQQANGGQSRSLSHAIKSIYLQSGITAFYTGLRWNLMTCMGKTGFRWVVISKMDDSYKKLAPTSIHEKLPWMQPIVVGGSLAFIESLVYICPLESMKTKDMTFVKKCDGLKPYERSLFQVSEFLKTHGSRRLWDGFEAVFLKQFSSWATYLLALDFGYKYALKYKVNSSKDIHEGKIDKEVTLNFCEKIGVTSFAGIVNVICNNPFDTVKTRMQKMDAKSSGFFKVCSDIIKKEGLAALYSGFQIKTVRSLWHSAITMTMMEHLGVYKSQYA